MLATLCKICGDPLPEDQRAEGICVRCQKLAHRLGRYKPPPEKMTPEQHNAFPKGRW